MVAVKEKSHKVRENLTRLAFSFACIAKMVKVGLLFIPLYILEILVQI